MKQGWETKTLGDVCDVLNGLWTGKKEPFVNICVIRNTNFTKDCKLNLDNVAYIDAEVKQFTTRKLKVGDIIVEKSGGSEKQPVGRVVLFDVESGDYSFSNFTSALRVKSGIDLNPNYLHKCLYAHYLRGETFKLQSKTTGLHNLDMKGYLKLPIPVPSSPEQEKIVVELDCLSGIIEKKKQQLKEYDALAQSIFYEMFGDPVENEKGWKIKKMNEVAKIAGGYAFKSNLFIEEGIPVLRIGNINTGRLKTDSIVFYQEDSALAKYLVYPGDLVMSLTGTVGKDDYGNVCVLDNAYSKYYLNQRNAKFMLSENIQVDYLKYFLKDTQIKSKLTGVNRGVRQGNISNKDIEGLIVPTPPLALQQEFASKIEAIEKQKALIKKSIEEVETLFNSRMDYYFN